MAGERFKRQMGEPWLAEAPPADSALVTEIDAPKLLTRLERQAAESGRLGAMLKRERRAAKAIHDRAEHDRAARAAADEELERLRQSLALCEQQRQVSCARLIEAEQELVFRRHSTWRKLLRRPPRT